MKWEVNVVAYFVFVIVFWVGSRSQYCPPLQPPIYGSLQQPCGSQVGSICNVKCNHQSLDSIGSCQRTCQPDRRWSGDPLVCLNKSIQCSPFSLPLKAALDGSMCFNYAGGVCRFSCDSGYSLTGSDFIYCTLAGTWSSPPPQCVGKECPPIDTPLNGRTSGNCGTLEIEGEIQSGSECFVSCDPGYMLVGESRLTCRNSEWSSPAPTCRRISCDTNQLQGVILDERFCTQPQLNHYCRASCPPNTVPDGEPAFLCTPNGWSSNFRGCRSVRCPPLSRPINGMMSGKCRGDATISDQCVIDCNPGYTLSGPSVLTCTSSGFWDRNPPECSPRECPPLRIPESAAGTNCVQATPGTRCEILCNSDRRLVGRSSFTCQYDGTWDSNDLPDCRPLRCSDWIVPRGGVFINKCSDGSECHRVCPGNPNQQCNLRCGRGYRLVGSSQPVYCSSDTLRWSVDPLPTCEPLK